MKKLAILITLSLHSTVIAADHTAIDPYITDDVVAVAYVDLTQIDTLGIMQWAENLDFGPQPDQKAKAINFMLQVQKRFDEYSDLGVRYVYVLFRMSDVSYGGPTWVVPVSKPQNTRSVMGLILSGRPDRFDIVHDVRPSFLPDHCETTADAVLGANSPEQLAMLKSTPASNNRDLVAGWQSLGTGHCGLLIFGDTDSRRVLREMFPRLPKPFAELNGPLIADRLLWGGLVAELPPRPKLRIIVQTSDTAAANLLQETVIASKEMLSGLLLMQPNLTAEDRESLVGSFDPQVEQSRFIIDFHDLLADLPRVAQVLTPRIEAVRDAAHRRERMNKFKQISLAMLHYESANGHFPPLATYSDDGRPLLSWRVHILPYLDEGELYARFHLEEPWDSEQNKQLIPLMPEVYADPDPAVSQRNLAGRTKYLVPTGPGTVFDGAEGTKIKDITDGTSNTILLVEVASMASPAWTEPKDWLVDFGNRWERLAQRDREGFVAAMCDGSARFVPFSTDTETLRRLVMIADGKTLELP